ncbi:MAG: IclR family transcriptional regulator [Thermoleophilia bacterium]
MTEPTAGRPAASETAAPLGEAAPAADANVAERATSTTERNRPAGYGRLVPAVEQATRILYHLAAAPVDDANLTEICRAVGIHKSKGYAILNTLRSAGLVVRNEPAKTYALGPGVLTLSRALLDRIGLAPAAEPHLAELAQATGATALLGLITTGQVFIVARGEAPGAMGVTVRVGHRYPLTWGAHGKAIVAFLPPARREALLAEEPLFFYGDAEKLPPDRDLRAELAEVRRQGFALDLGGVQAGINAVSAPVLNSRGEPAAVLVLVGTFPPGFAPEHGRRVAAVAREMSARLAPFLEAIS